MKNEGINIQKKKWLKYQRMKVKIYKEERINIGRKNE